MKFRRNRQSAAVIAILISLPASILRADAPETLQVPMIGNNGGELGAATLRGSPHGVVMRIEIKAGGLTPGWHGLHFHAVGDCSDKDHFMAAKAHVNHGGAGHGLLNPNGHEEGDLPNLWVAADGSARAEIATELVTLNAGPHALRHPGGSALIIHAGEDDHLSQPIGNSGARVACAVIN
jgi:Cu-Zn family superoxide dismutase